MNMKLICKKSIFVLTVIFLLGALTGCATSKPVEPSPDPNVKVEDEAMTKKLVEEKEVSGGKVYLKDNLVIATMIINDDASEEKGKEIAEKYAKKLKKIYKDMPVNVQAIHKGKNIANIDLE